MAARRRSTHARADQNTRQLENQAAHAPCTCTAPVVYVAWPELKDRLVEAEALGASRTGGQVRSPGEAEGEGLREGGRG